MSKMAIRDTVLRSLSAVGATKEAKYYAELFAAQQAERFALCLLYTSDAADILLV